MSVQFLDDTGNPIAAGFGVSITPGSITGTTDSTGSIAATLTTGTYYTAAFTGTSPPPSVSFYGNTTTGSYLTDDSGDILTDDSGNQLLYESPPTTVVEISGYASTVNLLVSQVGLEWVYQPAASMPRARLSQIGIETIVRAARGNVRLSQVGLEWIQEILPPNVRLSQFGIETLAAVVYTLVIEPPNQTVTATGSIQYHAILYANGIAVGEVEATWSESGGRGTIESATGLFTASSIGSGTISATMNE